jgi:hypothetical protein
MNQEAGCSDGLPIIGKVNPTVVPIKKSLGHEMPDEYLYNVGLIFIEAKSEG